MNTPGKRAPKHLRLVMAKPHKHALSSNAKNPQTTDRSSRAVPRPRPAAPSPPRIWTPRLMFSLRTRRRLSAIEPHHDHTSEQPKAGGLAMVSSRPPISTLIRAHMATCCSPYRSPAMVRPARASPGQPRNRVSEPYANALRDDDHLDADRVVRAARPGSRAAHRAPWRPAPPVRHKPRHDDANADQRRMHLASVPGAQHQRAS